MLPITSGDTALRSARLMIADHLNISQKTMKSRLSLSLGIFAGVLVILIFAKMSPNGFNVLWQYFAWANQTIAVFAFAMISIYLQRHGRQFLVSLVPGMFYTYVIMAYILGAKIGFNLPYMASNLLGVLVALIYGYVVFKEGSKQQDLTRA